MIKELFKDLAKYSPSMFVPALVGIMALPIITRLFPPEEYGNYILVMATVSVLSAISVAWLGSSTIRFFPAYKLSNELEKFNSILLKLTILSIGGICVVVLGILFLAQAHISANLYSLMRIGVLVFIVSSCSSVFLNLLRAKRQVTWYTSISIWKSVAGLGIGVALVIVFHHGVEGLLWGSLLSMLVAFPLLWKLSIGKPSLRAGSFRSSMSLEIAKYGIPAMMINLLTWMLSLSDRYILEFFRGSHEVGIYSVSYVISEQSIFLIVSLFSLGYIPIAFNIWESQGVKASQEFTSKLTRYYLIIGLPAAVGLGLLAKQIVGVLTVPEYYLGYRIVPMVAFGAFLVGVANIFTEGLTFHKRTDLLMLCYLGSGILNIGLNFIFIPKYGYMAAAATTFASYGFLLLITVFVSRRFFVWKFPFESTGKIVCASAVMGVIVYYIGNSLTSSALINLIAGMFVGVVVYVVMLFLLREIHEDEIQELQESKNKILIKIKQLITKGR